MSNYQAILFDFDGVLADSEPLHFECWREVLVRHGIDLPWDVYESKCIGVSDHDMIEGLCRGLERPDRFEEVWKEYPRKQQLFQERIATADVFHPETLELIHSLNGHKLAVVSSSRRAEIEPPLVRAGIRPRFEILVCGSEEVERLKPAPDRTCWPPANSESTAHWLSRTRMPASRAAAPLVSTWFASAARQRCRRESGPRSG